MCRKTLILLFVFGLSAASAVAQWHHFPAGQPELADIAVNSTGDVIYVACGETGLWRSADGGLTWTPLAGQIDAVHGIMVDQVAIAGTSGDSVVVHYWLTQSPYFESWIASSTDAGATWWVGESPISNLKDIQPALQVPAVLYAVGVWGLSRSEDVGREWQSVSAYAMDYYLSFAQSPYNGGTLYATGHYQYENGVSNGGIIRTTDSGQTWEHIVNLYDLEGWTEGVVSSVAVIADNTVLAIADSLIRSTDGGLSWNVVHGLPAGELGLVRGDLHQPGVAYLLLNDRGIRLLRSIDFGVHWDPLEFSAVPELYYNQQCIYQNGFGPALYCATEDQWLQESTNLGSTWTGMVTPPVGHAGHFEFLPEMVVHSGLHHWRHWTNAANEAWNPVTHVGHSERETTYFMSHLLAAQGETLIAHLIGSRYGDNRRWITSTRLMSHDRGLHWELEAPRDPGVDIQSVCYHGQTASIIGYVADETGVMPVRSADFGQTWQQIAPMDTGRWTLTLMESETAIFLFSIRGNFRSPDAGQTWIRMPEIPFDAWGGFAIDEHLYFLTQNENRLVRSEDSTWQDLGPSPDNRESMNLVYTLFSMPGLNDDTLLVLAERDTLGLWISDDEGANWEWKALEIAYRDQHPRVYDVAYDSFRDRLWISTSVGPFYRDRLDMLVATDDVPPTPLSRDLLAVYPNPFNSQTRIRYELLKDGPVKLGLYNVEGRLVQTLVDDVVSAGRHEYQLNGAGLASGLYFVRLKYDRTQDTQKVLLLR